MLVPNYAAENALGTIGAVLWSVQLLPQVVKSYKRKDTAGLSSWMLAIWLISAVFLGAYVIVQNISIPLIVQPQSFSLLCAIAWAQCLHYDQNWTKRNATLFAIAALVVAGGCEAAFVFGAKAAEAAGHTQFTTVLGILAVIFITGGLIPQYLEIARFKAVIGISLIFLVVDLFGGLFSMVSLFFSEGQFDVLAAVSYGAVAALELGVFILVPILNPSHRRRLAAKRIADEEALAGTSRPPSASIEREDTLCTLAGSESEVEPKAAPKVEPGMLGWMDEGVNEGERQERIPSRT